MEWARRNNAGRIMTTWKMTDADIYPELTPAPEDWQP
jgi:hypothetical protein